MIRILTAMQREADSLGLPCEVVGICAADLPKTADDDILVNVGYCGAVGIEPGTVVEPDGVGSYETGEVRKLVTHFDCVHAPCFTSGKFVTEPRPVTPAVYDMELQKIAELPHRELYVLKIVSDNLNEGSCEAFEDKAAWERLRTLLKGEKLI